MNFVYDNVRTEASSPGWTIPDAVRRTSDRTALPDEQRTELWRNLHSGKLVGMGALDNPFAPVGVLDRSIFFKVDRWDEDGDVINLSSEQGSVEIHNFRIYPVLRAQSAADYLHGLSIAAAIKRYVIDDPEVIQLSKCAVDNSSVGLMLSEAQAPGPNSDHHWPMNATAESLAFGFVDSCLRIIGGYTTDPPAAIVALSSVLADRIGALRELLAAGVVQADGTSEQSGLESPIGRGQWNRDISIDVQNSDLCDGRGYQAVPKYTGVVLRRPQSIPAQSHSAYSMPLKAIGKEELRTKTTEKSKSACVETFCELMRASPQKRTHSKAALQKLARERWPGTLTDNAIDEARKDAINITKAFAWRYAGAPERTSSG